MTRPRMIRLLVLGQGLYIPYALWPTPLVLALSLAAALVVPVATYAWWTSDS